MAETYLAIFLTRQHYADTHDPVRAEAMVKEAHRNISRQFLFAAVTINHELPEVVIVAGYDTTDDDLIERVTKRVYAALDAALEAEANGWLS